VDDCVLADVESVPQLCSRVAQRLNVPNSVRRASSFRYSVGKLLRLVHSSFYWQGDRIQRSIVRSHCVPRIGRHKVLVIHQQLIVRPSDPALTGRISPCRVNMTY